jgi:hypothetical protein
MPVEDARSNATPPHGLEGFTTHVDPAGRVWWYRREDGWDAFVRPVSPDANLGVFSMFRQDLAANYGVMLPDGEMPEDDGFKVLTNSDELARIMLGREDNAKLVEHVEQQGPAVPPWKRPLPEPTLSIDFTGLLVPAAILGVSIVLAVIVRYIVRR